MNIILYINDDLDEYNKGNLKSYISHCISDYGNTFTIVDDIDFKTLLDTKINKDVDLLISFDISEKIKSISGDSLGVLFSNDDNKECFINNIDIMYRNINTIYTNNRSGNSLQLVLSPEYEDELFNTIEGFIYNIIEILGIMSV